MTARPSRPLYASMFTPAEVERFWKRVDKGDGTGCWLYERPGPIGYGFVGITRNGKMFGLLAHRVSWALTYGSLEPSLDRATSGSPRMVLDHICETKACVRPDHLRLISQRENALAASKHHANATHCKNGHEYTPENTYVRKEGHRHCRICVLTQRRAKKPPKKPRADLSKPTPKTAERMAS